MARQAPFLVMALGILASTTVADETPAVPRGATLVVTLPADAALDLEGVRMKSSGEVRRFNIPPLEPGRSFSYRLKATWSETETPRTVERTITLRAGETVEVDLRPDAASPDERAVLELTNAERKKEGLAPLVLNADLCRAARGHSKNMAGRKELAHTIGTEQFTDRITAAGYRAGEAGENIAMGAPTAADVLAMWMRSPGHRANILNARYRDIGIGIGTSADGTRYYTQVFAVPAAR